MKGNAMFTGTLKDWKVTDKNIMVNLEVTNNQGNRELLAAMYIGSPVTVDEVQQTMTYEEGAE